MDPLTLLLWALAILAGLTVLTTIAFIALFAYAAVVGLKRMQKDDDEEIFTGGRGQ